MEKQMIADYAWLGKTQRSWHLWAGNPFCVSLFKFPLNNFSRADIVKMAKKEQAKEKRRFTKLFKEIEWLPPQEEKEMTN